MIEVIEYSRGGVQEISLDKASPLKKLTWIRCNEPSAHELSELAKKIKIEKRYLRMAIDEDEVPKVISVNDGVMFIIKAPSTEDDDLIAHSFAVIITSHYFITLAPKRLVSIDKFTEMPKDDLEEIFSQGKDVLLYEIYSAVIKDYFAQIDKIENKIDKIEEHVIDNPKKEVVEKIFNIKKTLIYFHKALIANKEAFFAMHRDNYKVIQSKNRKLFFELYNESVQLVEMVAIFRDVLTGTLDIYMSSISNNMNEVMKKLTVVASLILIPTLITGIYGMNFSVNSPWNMPELYWKYGYFFALGLMVLSVFVTYTYFKRKSLI